MKLFIDFNDGDESVGVWHSNFVLEGNFDIDLTLEQRIAFKKSLAKLLSDTFDIDLIKETDYHAQFNDECAECGRIEVNGKCPDKKCLSNYNPEEEQ